MAEDITINKDNKDVAFFREKDRMPKIREEIGNDFLLQTFFILFINLIIIYKFFNKKYF